MKNDIVVCTAITGNKDNLKDDQCSIGADLICYTDNMSIKSDTWEIRPACNIFSDPNRNAKIHKVLIHQYFPEYKYTLWIDGDTYLRTSVLELIKKYLKDFDIVVSKHHVRNTIYQEANVCIKNRQDNASKIQEQIGLYKKSQLKLDKLWECPFILRKNNKKIEKFNNYWWSEICRHSKRDQISFAYTVRKLNLKVDIFEGTMVSSNYFKKSPHAIPRKVIVKKEVITGEAQKKVIKDGCVEVVINKVTTWEREQLSPGQKVKVSQVVSDRWINRGIAHYPMYPKRSQVEEVRDIQYKKHNKVSIIMLVVDELIYIKKCLASLHKYTEDFELIVVLNGSNKETADYIKSMSRFDLQVIVNKKNMGFPYGCNQGIKVAKYDYLCFLNTDTLLSPNWLGILMDTFKDKKDAGLCGPYTSKCGENGQAYPGLREKRFEMGQAEVDEVASKMKKGYKKLCITGFCYLVKKEVFNKVGVFDYKRFKLGNEEETELNWRAKELGGYEAYLVEGAYVHHFSNRTWLALGIDQRNYNREVRDKWKKSRGKVKSKYIPNDVEIEVVEVIERSEV